MDEQRLNELNAMRDSVAGGETAYNAIRFNSTQEAPIPYDRFTNFINQTAHIEEQRDNSWVGTKFVKAFANGFLIAPARGLWGNLQASAEANLIKQLDDEELAKLPGVEKVTRETLDAHFPMIERLNVQADSTVGQYVYALTEGIGQMFGQWVVNMATGPIGGGVAMFSQTQGNQYADLRQQGVNPDKAFKYSMGNAAIQSALEQVSFARLFKALPKDSTTRQKVKEVMEGVITEGFTEFLQDLPDKLSNIGALQDNEGKTTFETALSIAREWDSNYIDNLKDMLYSGSIGAIIGGGAKGLQIAINKAAEKYILKDNITKIQEQAKNVKANGLSAKQAQTFIDAITGGTGTVNLDAQQVREFAYNQNVSLEEVANDLGTTKDAIEFAADNGLDITVSQGAMVASYDKNGFGQAMEPHMSFGNEGKSLNYFELQRDLEKTYGESSERQQSLKTELDAMEKSMLDAGIPQEQAKQGRALASAFAVAMNPEAPAEFLKKYKLRFTDKAQEGKGLFQVAFHGTTTRGINKLSTNFVGKNATFHGWGLYFGGKRLALNYAIPEMEKVTIQSKLGNYSGGDGSWTNIRTGANIPTNSPLSIALDFISVQQTAKNLGESFDEFLQKVRRECQRLELTQEQTDKTVKLVKENIKAKIEKGGRLENGDIFKVDIPEDTDLLNLDKKVSEQSPKIKEILNKLGFEDDVLGQEVYDILTEDKGSQKEASLFLNSQGIGGHYVVDGDEGPTYVIYNDAVVNYLGKEQVPQNIPDNFYADEAEFYKKYTSEVEQWNTKNKERMEEVSQYVDEINNLFERLYAWNTNIKDRLRFYNTLNDYVYNMHSNEQDDFGFTVEGAKKVISDLRKLENGLNDGSIKEEEFYNLVDSYMEKHYNQSSEGQTPKGQFSPKSDGSYIISMFKGRDASTVIHETGHYFFEVFMQESGLEDASPKLKKDRAAFLSYVGMTEEQWAKADFEGRSAAHERVATAFEQYLLEGKAPSKGLRGVFARFSKWLKAIYGTVVDSPDYAGLTDDVREAFDHWLAADADIEQAMKTRGIYGKIDSKLTGILSDKQRAWLEDQIEGARLKAAEILTKEYMSNFSSERKAAILQYKADIEKEVREQIAGLRINKVRKEIPDLFSYEVKRRVKYLLMADQEVYYTEERIGRPIEVANEYLNWVSYGESRDREQVFKSIQNEINACLQPELTVLEQGYGNGVRWAYVDNESGQEISFEEAQARDKARPGYKYKPVSENAKWYQLWFGEYHRQPTQGELRKLAEELYIGIDRYHVYGDGLQANTAEEAAELEAFNKRRKDKLESLYAERDKMLADDKYLGKRRPPKLSDDDALMFESLAEFYGYSSGSEMAQDILNAKTEERMVQDAIRARVKEKFPDYAQERALAQQAQLKALYDQDEGGMVAALEQQLIEEAAQKAFDREMAAQEQAAKQKERIAKAQEMKVAAEVDARKMMLEMSMDEALKANRFAMQERRAAANAKKALKKGDMQAASDYKYQQMVLHALVRHSLILKQEVEHTKKFVKRLRKTKKDMAHFGNEQNFNQIAHLLYRLGVGRKDYSPEQRTESLQEYIDQMTKKLGDGIPEIAEIVLDEGADIKSRNLTIEQYEQVRDSLQNLMAIVKNDIKTTLDEKAADFEEEKGQVLENLNKLDTVYTPSAGGVEVESFWKRQIAQRQSLDNFLEKMDNWTYGYFSKTFGNTLKHCADKQAQLKMEFDKAMSDAMKKWCPTKEARRQADQEHYYEELKANANKHTLVNMLIQMGNESSMRRLCESRIVGCEQSGLWVIAGQGNNYSKDEAIKITRQNLLDFLSKNLTKSDVEYAQAKVDAVNKLWPLLAEVNLKTKGFAPKKVEATPVAFKPKDGDYMTFQGGYYPLARDGRMGSMRAGAEALSDTENTYTPTNSMSTVQNTSKARTGAAYPVKLNYGYEFNMIEDTIHDIAYRETMMAFNKLLKDDQVYSTLKQKLGIENFNLLRETLWKCARPKNVQDAVMAERSLTSVASWIRRKTVNAVIACNLKVAMQNFGNIFLYGNTVEGFTQADVLAAMPDMFSGFGKHKAMRDKVFELSPFMRERALAPDFAMKEVAEENIILKNYKTAKGVKQAEGIVNKVSDNVSDFEEGAQKFGARLLEVTDNITAVPIWLQAYNKQLNMGKSQQEAIDFADTVIRRTLGSNRLQDVASIMRGGQMYKLFTAFQSFFNTQFNQWYREANIVNKSIKQGEYKEAFMRALSFALSKWLLACLANVIIGSASFIKPFEKDEKDWREINKELITYPVSMMGGPAGQVAMYGVQSLLGMQSYGYRLSIIENTVQKGGSFLYKANSVIQGKKEANELIEPAAEIISITYGIPLQVVRTGGNFYNIAFDDMSFELEDIMNRRRKKERDR